MGRWLLGALILLAVGLVYGLMTGEQRITDMQSNIQAELLADGYDWADVSMEGNVATVSGTAPSSAAQQGAIRAATDARCSVCKPKHKWHNVVDQTEVVEIAALPTLSPYTFSARKTADGNVIIDGFVPSENARGDVLRDAVSVFGNDRVTDQLRLADGAPDGNWVSVIKLYFRKLVQLDQGRFVIEDKEGALTGTTTDVDVQASLYASMGETMPDGYNVVGNVSVPQGPTTIFGQSGSQAICRSILADLRDGRKIQFAVGDAVIEGDPNIDLLSDIASAANQCPNFQIAINGYTSSEGDVTMNQTLSEARANAVRNYLNAEGGIDMSRMTAQGLGIANPIASNDTQEGREQNRRIEFILSRAE